MTGVTNDHLESTVVSAFGGLGGLSSVVGTIGSDTDGSGSTGSTSNTGQRGEITWSVSCSWMSHYVASVEIQLERTQEALDEWRAKTWAKLKKAYDNIAKQQKMAIAQARVNALSLIHI